MINPGTLDLSTLPSVPLESKSELPNKSAIYFAIDSLNNIQYIGKSVNLKQRWYGHHRLSQLDAIGNVRIAYLFMDEDLLDSVEAALIDWFKPALNATVIENDKSNSSDTVTIRIRKTAYDRLKQIAKGDRRDMIDILDLLLLEANQTLIDKLLKEKSNVKA